MAATRALTSNETRGIAIAVVAHVLIIALLSVQWTAGERRFDNPPMEVDLIAETAPVSTAPEISDSPPDARLGDEDATSIAPPEPIPTPPEPTPPAPPKASPPPKLVKKAVPPPKAPPAAKKPPAKAAPPGKAPPSSKVPPPRAGNKGGKPDGKAKDPPVKPPGKGVPAAQEAAAIRRSIDVSIKAAVGPRWNRCQVSGFDAELLKTEVKFRLTPSGSLAGFTGVTTTGQNDSNRNLVARHQECAKKAIQLAAPFDLPEDNYAYWQNYTLDFDKAR